LATISRAPGCLSGPGYTGECLLGAFAVIGNNVYRVVPDEVPIVDRQNVASSVLMTDEYLDFPPLP
jgi:hypothetical protein